MKSAVEQGKAAIQREYAVCLWDLGPETRLGSLRS